MKILAIGGCGSMARYVLKAAQNFDAIDEIIIADINGESATSFAASLNNKVSAIQLDVSDVQALKGSLSFVPKFLHVFCNSLAIPIHKMI